MTHPIKSPRKLIEVALPLDAINEASAREKSIRHGHPSTMHLWWARRPLAAARAVIFAQLVNDPGFQQGQGFKYGKNKKEAEVERKRLFKIIEDLVKWENTTNKDVLERARAEIRRSWREVCELNRDHPQASELFNPEKLPGLHDPFAGGGTIPLEAQRLGLDAYASDLNPVAVLINRAMIELPPKCRNLSPANPHARSATGLNTWSGTQGLAEDVRYYGAWLRDEAQKRIGYLYPPVEITSEMALEREDLKPLVGEKLTVTGWLWARTVKSPSPAFSHVDVPLATSFVLVAKKGKEAYVHPVVVGDQYRFVVKLGDLPARAAEGTKASGRGASFRCLVSDAPVDADYIKGEAQAGRIKSRMMAVVAEGPRGRVYLSPTETMETVAASAVPQWTPDVEFFQQALGFRVGNYGMSRWSHLFTRRQLLALTTVADLVGEARNRVERDFTAAGLRNTGSVGAERLEAREYAAIVCTYLAFAVSRLADRHSALCRWDPNPSGFAPKIANTFGRQALSMVWDFVEGNPFGTSTGNLLNAFDWVAKVIETSLTSGGLGSSVMADAQTQSISAGKFISTDPPYYDNIGYADLSDFFYMWLRRSLREIVPELFSTLAVPKAEELVATPHRHGGKAAAERFFLDGMTAAMQRLAAQAHPAVPVTIYYAFKQSDTNDSSGTSSTGWETFLEAVIRAGFSLTGTWPMRTELGNRMRGSESNALASSIVLVCQRRSADAASSSRREFIRELDAVLPQALDAMTRGAGDEQSRVAPVDLSQAIIGPGMAVFSKYAAVLEADGTPMSVKAALQLINRFLGEDDFDADTQFCLQWFEELGWTEGDYGRADVAARAKSTAVDGLKEAGVVSSGKGKVRLLRPSEYPADWDPRKDTRIPVWEALHQLIRAFRTDGESGAGRLLAHVKDRSEAIRQLAYRLYTLCERQGWAEDARAYNELVAAWTAIDAVAEAAPAPEKQLRLGL